MLPRRRFRSGSTKWRQLVSDPGAKYDRTFVFDVTGLEPQVTWGDQSGYGHPDFRKDTGSASLPTAVERQPRKGPWSIWDLNPV